MTFDELIAKKLDLFNNAENDLLLATANSQRQLWALISDDFDKLQVDARGNIRLTDTNIKIVAEIVNKLKTGLGATEFANAMRLFLNKFDRGLQINTDIARALKPSYTLSQAQRSLMNQAKATAIDLLTNEGYKSRIDQTFRIPLNAAIQSGANLRETVKTMREIIQGNKDNDGRILANVKTYAGTTYATAERALTNSIFKDLNWKWFRYVGGEIDTTRTFCEERNGKYFHRNAIAEWADEGEWSGQIEGTNSENIFVFLGGWNCRHSLIPVTIRRVPESIVADARAKGWDVE
jgi:hypothetical protein